MISHKLIHISDLHFSTQREGIVDAIVSDINAQQPHIIIVSGDLTQRAHTKQFKEAKNFFDRLNTKNILCVPGNHDISLYNPLERFLYPFYKYNYYIREKYLTCYATPQLAIVGVNSVTPYRAMGGDINTKELNKIKHFFSNYPKDIIKIIVMHHNLIRSERHKNMYDAERILNFFSTIDINLILSGHIHVAYIEQLKRNYLSHNMYVVTAGTAISKRTIQANSYNILEFSRGYFQLTVRSFKDAMFNTTCIEQFKL